MKPERCGAFVDGRVVRHRGNRLDHVRDLASKDRWHRFGYYAFPFDVPEGEFCVGLNGCVARPREDQTGHGTEAYLAARDWTDVGNKRFGVTLVQYDSSLVECGKIHADKKAFGQPLTTTHLYAYVLMDNHYHLLLETPEPNLAEGMRQVNGLYGQGFNRRHDRVGSARL